MATAVCVSLLIGGGLSLVKPWQRNDVPRDPLAQLSANVSDARIIQRIDCVLEQDRWSIQSPVFQTGESIQLAEGVVVIEFSRGATVTLEGPADLEILSDSSSFLHEGKLTAVVPDSAIGFEVLTPDARVIDHGTEFAVRVDSDGISETHVFEGEVEVVAADNRPAICFDATRKEYLATTPIQTSDEMTLPVAGLMRKPLQLAQPHYQPKVPGAPLKGPTMSLVIQPP